MTRASAPDERQTPESGKHRIAQLQSALGDVAVRRCEANGKPKCCCASRRRTTGSSTTPLPLRRARARDGRVFARFGDPVGHAQAADHSCGSRSSKPRLRRRRLALAGAATIAQSPLDEAIGLSTRSARPADRPGSATRQAQALNFAGVGLFYQGDYSAARSRYEQAAAIFRSLGDATSAALPLQNIAHIDYDSGDYATAIASFKSALDVLDPVANARQYVDGADQPRYGAIRDGSVRGSIALADRRRSKYARTRRSPPSRHAACTASAWSIWSSAIAIVPRSFSSEHWSCVVRWPVRIHAVCRRA